MENEEKRIVEIGGVKMEVDLRTARKVEEYRVGDRVKVLKKSGYGNEYKIYPGVIIGFDDFEKMPTMVLAYLKTSYSEAEIEYLYFNSQTEDTEIALADENYHAFEKSEVMEALDRGIQEKAQKLKEAEAKKQYFLKHFGAYFEEAKEEEAAVTE